MLTTYEWTGAPGASPSIKRVNGVATAWNPLTGTDRTFEEIWCQPTPPPPDLAYDLWYNQDGVPHEWVNGQGWMPISDAGLNPAPDGFMALPIESDFDGDTPDYIIPNAKIYYDGKWVSVT